MSDNTTIEPNITNVPVVDPANFESAVNTVATNPETGEEMRGVLVFILPEGANGEPRANAILRLEQDEVGIRLELVIAPADQCKPI